MTAPRRHIVRTPPAPPTPDPRRQERLRRLRDRLAREQAALDRWMGRLRRAFHALEKSQGLVARLGREIGRLEEEPSRPVRRRVGIESGANGPNTPNL
jgi:hypothetical protein